MQQGRRVPRPPLVRRARRRVRAGSRRLRRELLADDVSSALTSITVSRMTGAISSHKDRSAPDSVESVSYFTRSMSLSRAMACAAAAYTFLRRPANAGSGSVWRICSSLEDRGQESFLRTRGTL